MSYPDRNNPYSFDEYINKLDQLDFYEHDPFLKKTLHHFSNDQWQDVNGKMLPFSRKLSYRWNKLADLIASPDKRPYLENYDGRNHRVDRLVRPGETLELEKEVFGEAIFSDKTNPWESLTKRYLLHEIGEAGVNCPIACTEGLIALIEQYPDHGSPELDRILEHCKEGIDGDFGIGAQFMSEIQGGSDIPSNILEAVPDEGCYRLYGTKFFCSAMHADYAVVTAKVSGSEKVGAFVVPAWLPGNKEREIRNGCRINRIKWKMGTSELPTAEVEYDGAIAYAVGPTDRGVANVVGIVLTLSRITVGISAAAGMTRSAREALLYSEFRDVFGQQMCQFPLAAHQVRNLVDASRRATAGAYKIYDLFVRLGRRLQPGLDSSESMEIRKQRFNLRELIIIQKLCLAYECVDVNRKAMSIFGGHGVIEDFSSLPRLYRDAAVNELWEGPRNVLLVQVLRDLGRAADWHPPREFAASVLVGAPKDKVEALGAELEDFVKNPPILGVSAETMARAARWDEFCDEFFRTYQEVALAEIGPAPIVDSELLSFPEIWE